MRSVIAIRARSVSAALFLTLLTMSILCHTRPASSSDDKAPAKALPAELVRAIRDGNLKAVRGQLDAGALVNARDAHGNTPLLLAAVYAGPECVELLLKKGADVNATNKAGATPLMRAATNYAKSKLLIDAGADVKAKMSWGKTAIMIAALKYGNSKTVKLLLDKGADAKARDPNGVGPILVAASTGDLDTMKLLVERGAGVNEMPGPNPRQGGSRTPLGWAAWRNDVPMVRYLLERKANPNRATWGRTPLSYAAAHNSVQAAEVLLAHGARVDSRDDFAGFTALHWAAATDSPRADLVKLLLKHGADPNAEAGEKLDAYLGQAQTPRMLAVRRGRTAIVKALEAAGAKTAPAIAKTVRPARQVPDKPGAGQVRDAAERAVRLLQHSAVVFGEATARHAKKQNCMTCHQHLLPLAAIGHAQDRGIRLDQDAAKKQVEGLTSFFGQFEIGGVGLHEDTSSGAGYAVFGLIGQHGPPAAATDLFVHLLTAVQQPNGRWMIDTPRPPMQASDVPTTALAIQAIKHYGWAGRKAEFDAVVERGRKWLWSVKAETTEEAAYQLLGLHWAGEPAKKLAGLARALVSQQRKDGGWTQLPMLTSDGYATGQVMYALARTAKHPTKSRAWQRGLRYLLSTQLDDGSWHVVSRAIPFQPTMDGGFAHRRDGWISGAGTSWAVLAMTEVLPPGTTNEKPPPIAKKPLNAAPVAGEKVDFARQIKPLLVRSCIACHGPGKHRSNFRVDSRASILKGGNSGSDAVVPGQSARSPLLDYVSGRVEGMEMPPMPKRGKFAALTRKEAELVRAWIDQGAMWPKDVVLSTPKYEGTKK
jgi:N-acyl-D-amino-acid deacylase